MGRRATCFDNAVAESFFATYKKELIHTRPWGGQIQPVEAFASTSSVNSSEGFFQL
jgi:transposase InsO family protein